ncbi:EF-P beta-lysylation protein EpmB [Wenzhouxiangella sp. AB-CW3]|uniref:EF-P beta-lysylation protein EpmB n=1 Tax=Wenzhouxiangella sp. AB-CW3 TaxID=2771012 RepID=UPI00168ABED8|nr:EF-P beta-lysylation protein EpmB [Wenzhouxiangella sp. AB-CW3]QOC21132.1 EF-P beta-lysylation protein EpmB [Wenzhouxiangella sp. AB-CW3]
MQSDSLARTAALPKRPDWREQIRCAFRRADELLDHLGLPGECAPDPSFPMLVPDAFASRMEPGNARDPLLLQVLPDADEQTSEPGFVADPVGDRQARVGRGVLHKYHGRVLLVSTGACAVHCRYCFRQEFPYADNHATRAGWTGAVDYIASHPEIDEVILSGGDPLMLSTRRLEALTGELASIRHVRRLRIHTRLPVVLPDRVNESLRDWLSQLPWPVVVVIHANHAREFDASVDSALAALRASGCHLLNQAVLLRDINGGYEAQRDLVCRGLDAGVMPYYLHLLDRVQGASRFEVGKAEALSLLERMRRELSGYLVPRLVREEAGAPYKLPLL